MLQAHLAETLHQERRHELESWAANARLARQLRPPRRPSRTVRVHVGWWLVSTGLRLAVWDRRTASSDRSTELAAARSPS